MNNVSILELILSVLRNNPIGLKEIPKDTSFKGNQHKCLSDSAVTSPKNKNLKN